MFHVKYFGAVILFGGLIVCLGGGDVAAHHGRYWKHRAHRVAGERIRVADGIISVATAAGQIRVAAGYAERFKALIADFADAGYAMTNVHCFASGGHVRHSKHYLGQACDFNQVGGGTDRFMYGREAAAIIRRYGFTNGCSFHDCGHVGTDGQGGGGHTRYAAGHHHHRHALRHHRHYASR